MKVTILGSSGSLGQPGNPASSYLLQFDDAPSIIMDMGPGSLAKLQEIQDPTNAHVVFSHLHPDHCLDFPSLMVWRRFHPTAPARSRNFCFGPSYTETHLGRLSADDGVEVDDMSDTFAFSPWQVGQPELIDAVTITPFKAIHPVEAYSLRVQVNRTGKIFAYSGDTSYTEDLIECARDAEVFFCEATWGKTSADKAPDMHLSGAEAGKIARLAKAKRLVLVHTPPWCDPNNALLAAQEEFDGPIDLASSGLSYEL